MGLWETDRIPKTNVQPRSTTPYFPIKLIYRQLIFSHIKPIGNEPFLQSHSEYGLITLIGGRIMDPKKQSHYLSMSVGEIVKALCDHAQAGSQRHEEIKGALAAVLVKDLTEAIDRHERAATRLSNQLLVLNIVLGVFTVAGTVLTVIAFVRS